MIGILAIATFQALKTAHAAPPRNVIPLDGTWQIAEGNLTDVPTAFDHTVPVPGLVSLATPPFAELGPTVADRIYYTQKTPPFDALWYRRTFTVDGPIPATAMLKVAKAMYGTRVFLNGETARRSFAVLHAGLFRRQGSLESWRERIDRPRGRGTRGRGTAPLWLRWRKVTLHPRHY